MRLESQQAILLILLGLFVISFTYYVGNNFADITNEWRDGIISEDRYVMAAYKCLKWEKRNPESIKWYYQGEYCAEREQHFLPAKVVYLIQKFYPLLYIGGGSMLVAGVMRYRKK